MRNKKPSQWEVNENKAIAMADKFMNVFSKVDGFHSWETILLESMMRKLKTDSGLSGKPDLGAVVDTLQYSFGFTVLNPDSLAEQMRIDDFVDTLKANPYQLKLIA